MARARRRGYEGRRVAVQSRRAKRIYVQMPAYRDLELSATLVDLYAKAENPASLRVGVAWQYGPGEQLASAVHRLPGLEIIAIPASKSRGCNWARRMLQRRWQRERYTLFLDSHHRFTKGWDSTAIDMFEGMRANGVRKPIITAHLPAYIPELEPTGRRMQPYKIYPHAREKGLLTKLTSFPLRSWRTLSEPVDATFISLHFLFAPGCFNEELPCDPSIYFSGDEVATSLRAFCAGYDAFHPHRVIAWHSYDRVTRQSHWDDHLEAAWLNDRSFNTLARLFTGRRRGRFSLKGNRTLHEYEQRVMCSLVENT